MKLREIPRWLRTISHLRYSQIYWRVRYALCRRLWRAGLLSPVPAGKLPAWRTLAPLADEVEFSRHIQSEIVDELSDGRFTFLNESRQLGRPPDWLLGQTTTGRLWTVTLHYHEWAFELARIAASNGPRAEEAGSLFIEYVTDWIDRCDVTARGALPLAWNAYAVATRIDSWCRSISLLGGEWLDSHRDFEQAFRNSLWRQAMFLAKNIEWDLRGNHLIRDAVGLAWAGRIFDGELAAGWRRDAARLAVAQRDEQIKPDGCHYERSPMYHIEVMGDLMTLAQLVEEEAARRALREAIVRMAPHAVACRHADGGIPLFQDAATKPEQSVELLCERFGCLGIPAPTERPLAPLTILNTGLAVARVGDWHLFVDAGGVEPDEQPGHAHAGTLSLEADWRGKRLFVDPGAFCYDLDEHRFYDRSTAAHNTVCVDRTDSSEVWHIFRAGRRARVHGIAIRETKNSVRFDGTHDGYRGRRVMHSRGIEVTQSELIVSDRLIGRGRHELSGGWLLHPDWTAVEIADGWRVSSGDESLDVVVQCDTPLTRLTVGRPWHPSFGVELQTTRLEWSWRGAMPLDVITTIRKPGFPA